MIAAALVLALQVAAPSAAPEDVIVTALRRAAMRVRVVARTDRRTGAWRCVFKRRSGDAAVDAGMCEGLLACAQTVRTVPALEACMTPVCERLIAGAPAPAG